MNYLVSLRRTVLGLMASLLIAPSAWSSDFPARPIRVIVPAAAGGVADTLVRTLGPRLTEILGQPVIVENRPGANSIIGMGALASAKPDGYTLGIAYTALAVNPAVVKKLPYDTVQDLAPVSLLVQIPGVFVVHPSVASRNVKDLFEQVRKQPESFSYAIASGLSSGHLTMEALKLEENLPGLLGVTFRGAPPATIEVVAGRIPMMILAPTAAIPFIRDGKLVPIATTGAVSPQFVKDIPTLKQSGYPDVETYEWYGLLAPRGTPPEIMARIHEATVAALRDPGVTKAFQDLGMEIVGSSPADFQRHISTELKKMRALATAAKLDVE